MNWIVLGILIILSVATVWLTVLAAKRRDWGNILGAVVVLLVTVLGWTVSGSKGYLLSPENAPMTSEGIPELEITNQIEEIHGQTVYLAYVVVLNNGTIAARNCVIKIEHHLAQEIEYKFLGYALFEISNFAPHTQSHFGLLSVRSDDEGKH